MQNERLEQNKKNLIAWRENHDEEALIELLNSNDGLIGYFVKKYLRYGLSYEELFSIGREAFVKAINFFDYKNNGIECFSTYVSNAIKNSIITELSKEYLHRTKTISLNAPIGQNDEGDVLTYEDVLGTDELIDNIVSKFKSESIVKFFGFLTPMEKKVIVLRFAFNKDKMMSIPSIAKELKVSKEIVRRNEKKALIKLRKFDDLKELMN